MSFTNLIRDVVQDYNCDTCGQVFNSKKSLKKHMIKKHMPIGKYACEISDRKVRKSKKLRLLIGQDHENEIDD